MVLSVGAGPAEIVREALVRRGFGPFFATPCGVLAPLLAQSPRRTATTS